MSTPVNSIEIKLVNHVICEIKQLRKGEIDCANRMMMERIEASNRLRAMKCLIATGDSQYDSLISFLYEQLKEMSTKLILNY
jgi:hypothetical protein